MMEAYARFYLCSDIFISEVSHQRIDSTEFEVSPVDYRQCRPLCSLFVAGALAVSFETNMARRNWTGSFPALGTRATMLRNNFEVAGD
jgi:hypothetical protein